LNKYACSVSHILSQCADIESNYRKPEAESEKKHPTLVYVSVGHYERIGGAEVKRHLRVVNEAGIIENSVATGMHAYKSSDVATISGIGRGRACDHEERSSIYLSECLEQCFHAFIRFDRPEEQ
jgi:hypothetical protein